MSRTYADNAYNRKHGRAGLPIGSAVISKNTICGVNTKTYVDNAYNRNLGRVGMPHGSAVMSKHDGFTKWHYLDTDRNWFVNPLCVKPPYELAQAEIEPNLIQRSQSEQKDIRRVRKSELTRDKEFDAIVIELQRTKSENKTLKQQIAMYARQCEKQELYDIKENVVVEKKEHVKKLREQLREQEVELQSTKSENKTLKQQIAMYARQCEKLKQELYDIKENVVVEQKELVKKLRKQLREQEEQLESHAWSEPNPLKDLQTFLREKNNERKYFVIPWGIP